MKKNVFFFNVLSTKRKTIEIDLLKEVDKVNQFIKKCVNLIKKENSNKDAISAITLHGSGRLGFIEIGYHLGVFEPKVVDCAADVTHRQIVQVSFKEWEDSYTGHNRIIVRYAKGKEWSKTNAAFFPTLELPYFRFFRALFKDATKNGVFDELNLDDDCTFGVQTYFHHHHDFWSRDGKKVS